MPSTITPTEVEERHEAGRAAPRAVPRSAHAWAPAVDRPDPVALLEEESATHVPELVPIRDGRMLLSPFAFFRGAAGIMAADLAHTPTSGIDAQLCGDAHLSNFRLFGARPPSRLRRQTTSTRPVAARGSGTSSAWRRASRSPGARAACGRSNGAPPSSRASVATGGRCATSPRWATSTSGTAAWTR